MTEQKLNVIEQLSNLRAVVVGSKIGHCFSAQMDVMVVVYQDPDVDLFDGAEIVKTQELLTTLYDEPYVYTGTLHPSDATATMLALQEQELLSPPSHS